MFIEQTQSLEQENAVLSEELEEKRKVDEFESLEEEVRKELEVKLFIIPDLILFRLHLQYLDFMLMINAFCDIYLLTLCLCDLAERFTKSNL